MLFYHIPYDFIFKAVEHKFKPHEHMFKAREHMFSAQKHKMHVAPNRNKQAGRCKKRPA